MKLSIVMRPLAASTLLLFAACGGSKQVVTAENGTVVNGELANLDEAVPESVNETGDGVELVSLPPAAAADAPAAETAPLAQAAQIAGAIDSGTGVERIPFDGGWAWRRDGKIIRTASRDGRRVSWFRPGADTPFLVQQGEETYAYAGGRPQRAFDRRGRPSAVPAQRQDEARRLADQSRRDRDQAERAPRQPANDAARPGDRVGAGRGDRSDKRPGTGRAGRDTSTTTTTITTTTNSAADQDGRRGTRDRDRRNRRDDPGNHQ